METPELFYDRLSGHWVQVPSETEPTVGRWLVRVPDDGSAFMNSVPVAPGDFLCAEPSGAWRILLADGESFEGMTSSDQRLDDMEAESVRTLGRYLGELMEEGSTWLDWMDVVPLVPGMSDDVDQLPLDQTICELFGHLEAVCRKPRAHLNVEVERVPVSRARRLPSKAAAYLASHTEDWERPLLRGVLPKRVLAEVRHDEYDIYENRVAARLVDNLVAYLHSRTRRLRKLLRVFLEKEDYSSAAGGTHLRRERVHRLWGQSIDANEGKRRAEETLRTLEFYLFSLMGLMDSPLYREVPRRSYVAPTLRNTNVLANDQDYRKVADLWRAWVDAGLAKVSTPADVHKEAQELGLGMDRFAMLLLVRSFEQLGYDPREDDWEVPVGPEGRWTVERFGAEVTCGWFGDGRLELKLGDRCLIFVSLPAELGAAQNDEQVLSLVRDTVVAAKDGDGSLVVLYPEVSGGRDNLSDSVALQLRSIGNDPRGGLPDCVGFLPVSPWAIGSVERVSRAIRWFIDGARYDAYPPEVALSPEANRLLPSLSTIDWLQTRDGGKVLLIRRPPSDFEWDKLDLYSHEKKAETAHEVAVDDHRRLSDELRDAVRDGRTGNLKQQKSAANKKKVELKRSLDAISLLRERMADAYLQAKALLLCPACGNQVDPVSDFDVRNNDCFRCDCPECGARWGTRMCSNGHRYAMMLPGKFVDVADCSPGWEDRTYGSDLLAVPARNTDGSWGFVCPRCGDIT